STSGIKIIFRKVVVFRTFIRIDKHVGISKVGIGRACHSGCSVVAELLEGFGELLITLGIHSCAGMRAIFSRQLGKTSLQALTDHGINLHFPKSAFCSCRAVSITGSGMEVVDFGSSGRCCRISLRDAS
ncbi:hypothetical protein ACOME3_004887, partial [Neoechinorhynchus agilis]